MTSAAEIESLDNVLNSAEVDCRLEASVGFQDLLDALKDAADTVQKDASGKLYFRDGLGAWRAISIKLDGYGEIWFAAPEDDPELGVSAWFSRADFSSGQVATIIRNVTNDASVRFLDPDTGEFVEPTALQLRDGAAGSA